MKLVALNRTENDVKLVYVLTAISCHEINKGFSVELLAEQAIKINFVPQIQCDMEVNHIFHAVFVFQSYQQLFFQLN